MHFEKFLLDNYIASKEGQKVYSLFKNIQRTLAHGDKNKEILNFINSLLTQPDASSFFIFEKFDDAEPKDLSYPPFSEFEDYIVNFIENICKKENVTHRDLLGEIPNFSLNYFYFDAPAYAFPYLYPVHFNILEDIFKVFNIYLPPLPSPRKYKERCYYHIELCRSLYDFRQKYFLSPEEICVFLYGFAPKFIKRSTTSELPQPNKIWIVGGSKEDSENLSSLTNKSVFWWAGRENMRLGDIVFIYEIAPLSKIRFCARAFSDGYDDPFQYFSGKVWLCNPVKIEDITYNDLKNSKHFSNVGLIKSHMQGLGSGRELTNIDYSELKTILENKGFDASQLPETVSYKLNIDAEINDESDVETYLLEPFLEKLGVQQKHITRQMPLRMGRGIRYYPDYVINAVTTRGSESGKFIWEAKYRIVTKKDFIEAFDQAKSYALRLSTNGLGLVSYEGIWLALVSDNYQQEKVQHFSWTDLENKDIFQKVSDTLKKYFSKSLK